MEEEIKSQWGEEEKRRREDIKRKRHQGKKASVTSIEEKKKSDDVKQLSFILDVTSCDDDVDVPSTEDH
jgi:hypothetical protein